MISHVTIGTADVERAEAFYRPLMALLGWTLKFSDASWAGWKVPDADRPPLFIVMRPFNDSPAASGNGAMVAFLAASRAVVDQIYRSALEQGGSDEGHPGLRPQYHPSYYGAYVRDLDGTSCASVATIRNK